ncbi:Oligopeptidase A [BD1-7 clade bacterium]|uniref:oligopeptidase A n=1 Tax=BD1-7 clade bacterium TaxID=2029982 RepID=A0A5S9MWX2_9GAMM|nr:Oligopeptidase A [BD1-7 clade bacterium]CAA0083404.1 Oligopeptidase A [BD1-7 clade bacterium]
MQQTHPSLPIFSDIDIATIETQLDGMLADSRKTIDTLATVEQPDWQNFALPLQNMDMALEDFFSPISHLNGVKNNDELRDVYQNCITKLTEYGSEVGQNAALFAAYERFAANPENGIDTAAQHQWLAHALRDFRLSGIALPEEQQTRFKAINARLAELGQTFSNHVLDATHAWHKHITDKNALAGLPESALQMLAQQAETRDKDGYLLTLDFPVYHAVITYADDRALRQEIYQAFMTRASDQGPQAGEFDNSEYMGETLALRHELAGLLDFSSYAERSLVTKMADSVAQVTGFLRELGTKARPYAEKELATLRTYAQETCGIDDLQSWDFSYISEKYRQSYFALSDEKLREYFPLTKVLDGLFALTEQMFAVSITEETDFDHYHPDVRFFTIRRDGQCVAGFYLDLYARQHKRGGAWMADCRSRYVRADGGEEIPVAFLVCNFRPATGDQPALLGHGEVTTLFHEFGHGLHHMLTAQKVAGISGIAGVEWDAVELPSQFMENWCWQAETIAMISQHFETGEALPATMLDAMLAAKNFNEGLMTLRQVEFALFDMLIHADTSITSAKQIQVTLDNVRQEVAVLSPPTFVRFQHGFSHIFAGGYAAGYFSYKWAEVLSADAFAAFEENGLFDKPTSQAFLHEILEVGSSRPAAESFEAFRGRAPSIDALLRHGGLAA